MSTDEKGNDEPIVQWGATGWDDEPRAKKREQRARRETQPRAIVVPSPTPPPAQPPAASGSARRVDYEEPEVEVDFAAAEQAKPAPVAKGPLWGRGLLMLCAAGYLLFVAFLHYETLGALHREASVASGAQLASLQKTHASISMLTYGNAIAGGGFTLASLLLLVGWRGLGKFLLFCGAVFLVGFVYVHFKEAKAYLRDLDLLIKLIILAVASMSVR